MVDRSQVDLMTVVRTLIANATGLALINVILGNQSAPAPTGAYATVLTLSVTNNGIDWHTNKPAVEETELESTTKGSRNVSFSVQFFRELTVENVRQVMQYPHTPNGKFFLQQNKMVWRTESQISQVDQVVTGQRWEDRSVMTLNLGFTEVTTQQIQILESLQITVNYSEGADATDIEEVINIS